MSKPYRVRTCLITSSTGPVTLVCTEVANNRYQLHREAVGGAGTLETSLLVEGPRDVADKFFDRAKHGLLYQGATLAAEWLGRGSAEHELQQVMRFKPQLTVALSQAGHFVSAVSKNGMHVVACVRAGELAYRSALPLEDALKDSLKAFLGHTALSGQVLELLVSETKCTLLQVLSKGASLESLYAQVPALRPSDSAVRANGPRAQAA